MAKAAAGSPEISGDVPVAFSTFAATLRPIPQRDPRGAVVAVSAGQPDEVWLKFIRQQHGMEKHTMAEWSALIDAWRDQPAHPAGM